MDRNEKLAESLKKYEHEHRNLASILLNAKAKTEGITYGVSLFLMSFESYLRWKKKTCPEWEFVNFKEVMAEDKEESQEEMEAFLKDNPLHEPREEKEERIRKEDEMKKFKSLLDDPKAAWKEIDGEGGLNEHP